MIGKFTFADPYSPVPTVRFQPKKHNQLVFRQNPQIYERTYKK